MPRLAAESLRHWLKAVGNLIRWLRANGCWDNAAPLEQEAQSLPPSLKLEAEAMALADMLDCLSVVRNHPPRHLTTAQRKDLKDIHGEAVESVLSRRQQVAREKANTDRVVNALAQYMDSRADLVVASCPQTPPTFAPATPPTGPETSEDIEPGEGNPAVDEEDERILRALAAKRPRLQTQDQIEIESNVSRRTISERMKSLLKEGLADRPKGPKSGTTITERGLNLLKQIDAAKVAQ
jgi:predicted transcriptional regulator